MFERVVGALLEGTRRRARSARRRHAQTVDQGGRVVRTVDRSVLRAIQTRKASLPTPWPDAYADAGDTATDDAGLAERAGLPVQVVEGDPLAFKITKQWDLRLARTISEGRD